MMYNNDLVAKEMRKWESYLHDKSLPRWDDIPNIGYYMEQLLQLLREYFDYLPPDVTEGLSISATTINNYVRIGMMPGPVNKKYYRIHIAYLIMIFTLKITLVMSTLQKIVRPGMDEEETRRVYTAFARRHKRTTQYFVEQITRLAANILHREDMKHVGSAENTEDMITSAAVASGLYRLMVVKVISLQDKDEEEE